MFADWLIATVQCALWLPGPNCPEHKGIEWCLRSLQLSADESQLCFNPSLSARCHSHFNGWQLKLVFLLIKFNFHNVVIWMHFNIWCAKLVPGLVNYLVEISVLSTHAVVQVYNTLIHWSSPGVVYVGLWYHITTMAAKLTKK
jgi:hypothetical protein